MMKLFGWLKRVLFPTKKVIRINHSTFLLMSKGSAPVTEEDHEKYHEELKKCLENRRNEYPTWDEVMEAMIEAQSGHPAKLHGVLNQRKQVQKKYPKPKPL